MLIVVVYVGIKSGPVTGLLAGTVAGLIQDALSSGILGIGGLAKTLVGFQLLEWLPGFVDRRRAGRFLKR